MGTVANFSQHAEERVLERYHFELTEYDKQAIKTLVSAGIFILLDGYFDKATIAVWYNKMWMPLVVDVGRCAVITSLSKRALEENKEQIEASILWQKISGKVPEKYKNFKRLKIDYDVYLLLKKNFNLSSKRYGIFLYADNIAGCEKNIIDFIENEVNRCARFANPKEQKGKNIISLANYFSKREWL